MARETYHREFLKQVIASKYLKEREGKRDSPPRSSQGVDFQQIFEKRATHHQDLLKELLAGVARVAEIGHSGD